MSCKLKNLTISCTLFGIASLIHAAESDMVRVGLGASAVSRYPGSDKVAVVPAPLLVLQHGPWRLDTTTYRKPFVGTAIAAGDGDVEILVGAVAIFGRSEDKGERLQGQPEIDPTLAAAASLAWAPGQSLVQFRLQGIQDALTVGQGLTVRGDMFLRAPPMRHLLIQVGGGVTWGDHRNMQTWFGAHGGTPANPGPDTGAGAGLRSTHLVLEGLVLLTGGWEGVTQIETGWLQGDAAGSPLTARRQQLDASLGLAYSF